MDNESYSERRGLARSIMRNRNSCTSCFRPLFWEQPNPPPGTADYRMLQLRDKIKTIGTNDTFYVHNSLSVGTGVESCHLVHLTCVPEIGASRLYKTPATDAVVADPSLLLGDNTRRAVFKWTRADIQVLCPHMGLNSKRMVRLQEEMGIHEKIWLGCKTCNTAHNCFDQMRQILCQYYVIQDGRSRQRNDQVCYTLMYDCMAWSGGDTQPLTTIPTPNSRKLTWSFELWLNYACIEFLALQLKPGYLDDQLRMRMAHVDMGIADWVMSQILAGILYMKYDIDIGIVELHQRFLALLMIWAKRNQACPDGPSPMCLWRWVLGEQCNFVDGTQKLCRSELGSVPDGAHIPPRTTFTDRRNTYRLLTPVSNLVAISTTADLIQRKIIDFTQTWIPLIGYCLTQQAPHHLPQIRTLQDIFWHNVQIAPAIRRGIPGRLVNGARLENYFWEHPNMQMLENEYSAVLDAGVGLQPRPSRRELYGNYIWNAWRRFEFWGDLPGAPVQGIVEIRAAFHQLMLG